jgi:hypothetical protein
MLGMYYTINAEDIVYTDVKNNKCKKLVTFNGKDLVGDIRIYDLFSENQSGLDVNFCNDALVFNPNGRKGKWARVDGLYARNNGVTPAFKVIFPNGDTTDWDLKSCIILSKSYELAVGNDVNRIKSTYKLMENLTF